MPDVPEVKRAELSRVDKPWGYELRWAVTDRYLGKLLHVNKGEALSLQYHERKDEYQYVVAGSVDIEVGGADGALTTLRMSAGDTLHIKPGTRHRITAIDDTDIFEVSTPDGEDVVRIADRYGRAPA
jgi:mannose-6-phosphate isomerase